MELQKLLKLRKFEVLKTTGEPITIPVNPDIAIPSGVLINKFIYSDGSVNIINKIINIKDRIFLKYSVLLFLSSINYLP